MEHRHDREPGALPEADRADLKLFGGHMIESGSVDAEQAFLFLVPVEGRWPGPWLRSTRMAWSWSAHEWRARPWNRFTARRPHGHSRLRIRPAREVVREKPLVAIPSRGRGIAGLTIDPISASGSTTPGRRRRR
jgi:hypothetical protein